MTNQNIISDAGVDRGVKSDMIAELANWPAHVYPVVGCATGEKISTVMEKDVGCVTWLPVPDGMLAAGATVRLPMWIRGPDTPGEHSIDFLFYYEPAEKSTQMR